MAIDQPAPPGADRMLSFLNDWNDTLDSKFASPLETLYHYTDVHRLKGILSFLSLFVYAQTGISSTKNATTEITGSQSN